MTLSAGRAVGPLLGSSAPGLRERPRAGRVGLLRCRLLHLHRVALRTIDDGRQVLVCSRCGRGRGDWRPAAVRRVPRVTAPGDGVSQAWFTAFHGRRP